MTDRKELIKQAERTYEALTKRLEKAVARGEKFPARGDGRPRMPRFWDTFNGLKYFKTSS